MASVRRQLVKTPLGYVTYIWLEGGVVPYEVLMSDLYQKATQETKKPHISLVESHQPAYK